MEPFFFRSRGIGLEQGICFVCEHPQPPTLLSNICAVVKPSEREQVLALFDKRARAHASRDHQVIICACLNHERSLEYLNTLRSISRADVNVSKWLDPTLLKRN